MSKDPLFRKRVIMCVVGIGTIISAFMMGPMIDWFNIHLFEPMLK